MREPRFFGLHDFESLSESSLIFFVVFFFAALVMVPLSAFYDTRGPVTMRVDHPFVYGIVERASGTLIFQGHLSH